MNRDQKFGLSLLIFCVFLWFFIIPSEVINNRDALFFPQFITIWLAICAILLTLRSSQKTIKRTDEKELMSRRGIIKVINLIIVLLIYVYLIDFLGFFVTSFFLLLLLLLIFKVRNWIKLIGFPFILLLFLYILIEKILFFPLPRGKFF